MKKTTIIKICTFFIVILVVILINFKNVYAYFIHRLSITHEEAMGDIDFEVVSGEIEVQSESLDFNNESYININEIGVYFQDYEIKNTGSYDTLLRINIEPYWINEDDDMWTGDVNFIKYSIKNLSGNYDSENSNCDDMSDNYDYINMSFNDTDSDISSKINYENESYGKINNDKEKINYIDGFYHSGYDKYFYLGRLFKSGESIKLRVYFYLNKINSELSKVYDGKKPRIKLSSEIVQCTKAAYRSVWNCDDEVINILDDLCDF